VIGIMTRTSTKVSDLSYFGTLELEVKKWKLHSLTAKRWSIKIILDNQWILALSS
jgi:hypothetical protein